MLPTPKKFIAFLDGRGPEVIPVGRVPVDVSAYIGARTSDVLMARPYALKLIQKHALRYADFEAFQSALDDGWACIDQRANPPALVFVYCDPFNAGRNYKLAIKRNGMADELWVKTFHRIKEPQYTKLLMGLERVREHLEMTPGNE